MKRLLIGALGALSLLGCAPKEVKYAVKIVSQNCEAASNPFDQVKILQVRVSGPDMTTITANTPVNAASQSLTMPEIPAGLQRVIEVRAYDGEPDGAGRVISVGRSLPIDVPDVVPLDLMGGSIPVNVILRRVGQFSPIVSAAAPSQCQQLRVPRAGHTATLMKSGKVLIAGGYNLRQGTSSKQALADAELFNPGSGAFELATPISINSQGTSYPLPRAFHTATLVPNGQIAIWGGEAFTADMTNAAVPTPNIVFYDEGVDAYGAMPGRSQPESIARSHHSAAIDANGMVLIVGGVGKGGTPVTEIEWLDPGGKPPDSRKPKYEVVVGNNPRLDATVSPAKNGEFIAVAGGTDGTSLLATIDFYKFNGTTFAKQTSATPPLLREPRRGAAGALIRDNADLLVLGGYSSATTFSPIASSELITAASGTVTNGPVLGSETQNEGRGDVCAAQLGDGSVLISGGRTVDGSAPRSDARAVIFTTASTGGVTSIGAPNLPRARYFHTCTTLADGSVLVTGGVLETAGNPPEILQDAYIYTPAPLD